MGALVLALNPSIDAEWRVDRVRWEERNTVGSERRWAGGKGVNVARWLRHQNGESRLLLPIGGETGREIARHLRGERLPARFVPLRQATRVNVIVTTRSGRQLRFNPLGPEISREEWLRIARATRLLLKSYSCLVLSGSLPQGLSPLTYARLIRYAHRAGVKTVLDCDGAALAAAVEARPFLVKPNEHELAAWSGRRPLHSQKSLARAARALSAKTGGWVLVSCGSKGGLLLNESLGAQMSARPPHLRPVNTVGAGDAMVAAVTRQIELGRPPEEWLRWGVAAGAAATQCAAGKLPSLTLIGRLLKRVIVG